MNMLLSKVNFVYLAAAALGLFLLATFFISNKAFALAPTTNPVAVRGNLYNVKPSGIVPLPGLVVTVRCTLNGQHIKREVIADGNGLYTVTLEKKCDAGSPVKATTSYNGQTTEETVFVSSQSTATLNFYF